MILLDVYDLPEDPVECYGLPPHFLNRRVQLLQFRSDLKEMRETVKHISYPCVVVLTVAKVVSQIQSEPH